MQARISKISRFFESGSREAETSENSKKRLKIDPQIIVFTVVFILFNCLSKSLLKDFAASLVIKNWAPDILTVSMTFLDLSVSCNLFSNRNVPIWRQQEQTHMRLPWTDGLIWLDLMQNSNIVGCKFLPFFSDDIECFQSAVWNIQVAANFWVALNSIEIQYLLQ